MHTHTPTHYLILLVIGDRDKWGRGGGGTTVAPLADE